MDSFKEQGPERRGKSWKREREERGRRQQGSVDEKDKKLKDSTKDQDKTSSTDTAIPNAQIEKEKPAAKTEGKEEKTGEDDGKTTESGAEKQKMEEEEEQRIREEEIQRKEDEKKYLLQYIEDTEERLRNKIEMRNQNQNAALYRPDESYFSKLDSSLKKNTAFVRRLKNFTEAQRDAIVKDMLSLNLTKYISEVAAAMVEAKLKMSDITAAIHICSLLHQKYQDFGSQLLDHWNKNLSLKKDEKVSNLSKLRVDLRFYAELISVGLFSHKEGLPLLGNVLTVLINMDKEEHNNISIILSFCKHCGEDYAGLIPRKIQKLAEEHNMQVPKSDILSVEKQRNVRQLLRDYYSSLSKHLIKDHHELQAFERQNCRILQTKGELNSERKEKFESMQIAFQKLLSNAQQFLELLDEDLPDLPVEEFSKQEDTLNMEMKLGEGDSSLGGGLGSSPWEDDETRAFYESLLDLKAFIPSILYKDSAQPSTQINGKNEEMQLKEEEEEEEMVIAEMGISPEIGEETDETRMEEERAAELEAAKVGMSPVEEEPLDIIPPDIEVLEEKDEPEASSSTGNRMLLDAFLNHLPNCVNKELIDAAAEEFCMKFNTKHNRRKLVKALFSVPRTRLDLLPFYARLVATLNPCMPDVALDLAQSLKQDFKYHVRKKDQINIESKIKVVHFIGELVLFSMYTRSEALACLKMLLFDFTHHHIEMACNLLETCGRFLFLSPDSHHRTKVYLEQIVRKKSVFALDSRYTTMIENAYYHVNPPEVSPSAAKKERPPMHEYIRKLLYQDLGKNNTEKILRQMRKLNWDSCDLSSYANKCLAAMWNVKYYNIRCVASLVAGLASHQDAVGPQVVDWVLEDIRIGMEVNNIKYNQRRVSMVKYLGELYNYRMVESAVIFKVLYSFITFGVSFTYGEPSELDPPESLFRIRITCVLLDTCGQYFNSGSSKKKLDYYFIYFQRYYLFKHSDPIWNAENTFPVAVEYMVKDTMNTLRPKMKLYETYKDAQKAVSDLEAEFLSKLVNIVPSLKQLEEEEQAIDIQESLGTIRETDEADNEGEGTDIMEADLEMDEAQLMDLDWENTGESLSQSQHSQPHGYEEYEHSATQGDEGMELTGNDEGRLDMDDDFSMPGGPKHINCTEDDDFMTAFDKMVSENIQDRSKEIVKAQQLDISVPLHVKGGLKKTYEQLQEPEPEESPETINFVLMIRRGNKQQYKNLAVPVSSELAMNLKNREEAERVEKEHVKRLTLDFNERQEEEDYQEMLAQTQKPTIINLNRERRQKYQHPKGAPDADLIFGPKKVR